MNTIIIMYITMLSTILSGILNMMFIRTPLYKKYKYPIDMYRTYKDNKRIFGDNKTIIGCISMITINMMLQTILGSIPYIANTSEFYKLHSSTIGYNLTIGFLLGLAYIICELPNSFIKRRLDINPGSTESGVKGTIFFVIDQFDSMFGVILILVIFSKITFIQYIKYVLLGGLTHLTINIVLHTLKIKKNI